MRFWRYFGAVAQLIWFGAAIATVPAITPAGTIVYRPTLFTGYLLLSVFVTGPLVLPGIERRMHAHYLSAKPKQAFFTARERTHQSPYLFDPVKFEGEPHDIGKEEEVTNVCVYIVLLLAVTLLSPGLWAGIVAFKKLR